MITRRPTLLQSAILTIWASCFLYLANMALTVFAEDSLTHAGGAYVDSDQDGLTDDEEADYSLNPNNPNTDGSGTIDGLDGWAGNVANGPDNPENTIQALYAPPRVKVKSYALVDLGVGTAGKLNKYGDTFINNAATPSGMKVFKGGQFMPVPVPSGLDNFGIRDINSSGDVIGVGSLSTLYVGPEWRIFHWSPPTTYSTVLQPFPRLTLQKPYESGGQTPPVPLYKPEAVQFYYWSWAFLDSGDVMARQDYTGFRDWRDSATGRWRIKADFHDYRFHNLNGPIPPDPYPTPTPGPSPVPTPTPNLFAYAYEDFIQASNNGNPTNIPPDDNFGSYHPTKRGYTHFATSITNSWKLYTPVSRAFGSNKFLVNTHDYLGANNLERKRLGILSNGIYTDIADDKYFPKLVNNQADIIADHTDGSRYFMIASLGYTNKIKVPYFQGSAALSGFNNHSQVLSGSKLWQNFKPFPLENLCLALAEGGSFTQFSGTDINDKGLIIGNAKKVSDNATHAVLLVPVEVKVWQPEGHQLPTGAGRVYNDYPAKEPIATSVFALWPDEEAYIRIKDWESIVQSLPANSIDWSCKRCSGESDALTPDENKLRARVKWLQPTNEAEGENLYETPTVHVIELTLGEEKHEIMFAVPDVGVVTQQKLVRLINVDHAALIAKNSEESGPFEQKTLQRFGPGPKHDAIKHASWSAWMAQLYGPKEARFVANAHEATGKEEGGLAFDAVMDLYNNAIGRLMGAEVHSLPKEEWLTIDQWIDWVEQVYDAGELVIWSPTIAELHQREGILRLSDKTLIFGEKYDE